MIEYCPKCDKLVVTKTLRASYDYIHYVCSICGYITSGEILDESVVGRYTYRQLLADLQNLSGEQLDKTVENEYEDPLILIADDKPYLECVE